MKRRAQFRRLNFWYFLSINAIIYTFHFLLINSITLEGKEDDKDLLPKLRRAECADSDILFLLWSEITPAPAAELDT